MTKDDEQSRFARRFEEAFSDAVLPESYRDFIASDAYLPYRTSFIRGLWTYGPVYVRLTLASPALLKPQRLFEESGIDPQVSADYHPIATLPQSPQFLAIGLTDAAGPVFLWHHETGAFHRQFESFSEFLQRLRTPQQMREEKADLRKTFASIRRNCKPALALARKRYKAGEYETAGRELDRVLCSHGPIRYDGHNDFNAIGILCDCFNLRGRVLLAMDRVADARAAFLDAIACGGTPYWEALTNVVVTSFLLGDIESIFNRLRGLKTADFAQPPGRFIKRNFTSTQGRRFVEAARSQGGSDELRAFAAEVLSWSE